MFPFPKLLTHSASSFATTISAGGHDTAGISSWCCAAIDICHDSGSETCGRSSGSSTVSGGMASIACLQCLLDIVPEHVTVEVSQPAESIHTSGHALDSAGDLDGIDPPTFADRACHAEIAEARIVRNRFAVIL